MLNLRIRLANFLFHVVIERWLRLEYVDMMFDPRTKETK